MKNTVKKIILAVSVILMISIMVCFAAAAEDCNHNFAGEYQIVVDSTCTATGAKALKCTECGAFDIANQEIIPMKDHTVIWTATKAATCAAEGSKSGTCSVCHKTITQTISKKPHNFGELEVISKENCIHEGKYSKTCKSCGIVKYEYVEKTDHVLQDMKKIEPTCEDFGYEGGKICVTCHEILVPRVKIAPLGHEMEEVPKYIPPTVDEEGNIVDSNGKFMVSAPTCSKPGQYIIKCTRTVGVDEQGKEIKCEYREVADMETLPHVDTDGDNVCDDCGYAESFKACNKSPICFCHYDTPVAKFVRWLNTTLNKLLSGFLPDDSDIVLPPFRCCDDMVPYVAEPATTK